MREILHILRKDVRRHWLEILISLILLGLYVKITLRGEAVQSTDFSFPWLRLSERWIVPALIIFWIVMAIRLVHGENLVGDRQWWITKPYEWWKLLAAKEIFLIVVIGVPLLAMQLFFLRHSGFSLFSNLLGLFNAFFGLALFLLLPAVALGSLTKNMGQVFLAAIAAVILLLIGIGSLAEYIPSVGMSSAAEFYGTAIGLLVIGSVIGAIGLQYSRRKTWLARALILAAISLIALLSVVTPFARFVEKKYPLLASSELPFSVSARIPAKRPDDSNKQFPGLDALPNVFLSLPVKFSGAAPAHVFVAEGSRVRLQPSTGLGWDSSWTREYLIVWPGQIAQNVTFELKRKDFERLKTQKVRLLLEIAFVEEQEKEPRDLTLAAGKFSDPQLGICHLNLPNASSVECIRPFSSPGLLATFDPTHAACPVEENDEEQPENELTYVRYAMHDDTFEPKLDPVEKYSLDFRRGRWGYGVQRSENTRRRVIRLCAGDKIRVAKPEFVRNIRIQMEIPEVDIRQLSNLSVDYE